MDKTNKIKNKEKKVEISPRETLNGNIDYAKVVVTEVASGKIVTSKRVVLLAESLSES